VNRDERRRVAKQFPKEQRRDIARALKRPVPTAGEVARQNLERMGMQIVEAKELLGIEGGK
jgi:hypothetical protein